MATEDRLEGARNGLAFFYAYMEMVGKEIGMDRALALGAKSEEMMGSEQGKMIKKRQGGKDLDIDAVATIALNTIKDGFGINSEVVERSPERIAVRCGRCPVYEAAQSVGIDTDTIETQCRTGSLKYMDAMVKQLNPRLSYQLTKFRSGSDDFCDEEILLR